MYVVYYRLATDPMADKVGSAGKALQVARGLEKAGASDIVVKDQTGRKVPLEELASKAALET